MIRECCGLIVKEYSNDNIYFIEENMDLELCKKIVEMIEKLPLKMKKYSDGNNVKCYVTSGENLEKTSEESYYYLSTEKNEYENLLKNIHKRISTNDLNGVDRKDIRDIFEIIEERLIKIKNIMGNINEKLKMKVFADIMLRKIYGQTRLHTDGILNNMKSPSAYFLYENGSIFKNERILRSSSIIIQLNDDYEGGIFNFPKYDVSIKLKRGSAIIFPPYWTHEHMVSELENKTYRYTITTWGCETF